MSSELNPKLAAQQWLGIIVLGLLSIVLGAGLGFGSQALMPVQTFPVLPKPNPKKPDENPLPKVYWLKQYSTRTVGNVRIKEKAVKESVATDLSDREIGQWLNRIFGSPDQQVKEDIDAKLGVPFVRIGGQGPGEEKEPVLTVTMPFNLKVLSLPVSEVPMQFTAKPVYDGGRTTWDISNVRVGHARVPNSIARSTVTKAVEEIVNSKKDSKELWPLLEAYRRVVIRDNKLFLEAPVKPVAPAVKEAEKTTTPVDSGKASTPPSAS